MRTRFTRFAQGGRNVPIAAGLVALLLVAIGIVTILQNEVGYRAQKLREAQVQAEILAASVTAALDFKDAPTARESVDALGVNPQIVSAGVYDSDGTLFAGYERRRGTLPRRASEELAGGENDVEAIAPVIRSGEPFTGA